MEWKRELVTGSDSAPADVGAEEANAGETFELEGGFVVPAIVDLLEWYRSDG